MIVLTLFNKRRAWGGEDLVVDTLHEVLRSHGVTVHSWLRDVAEIGEGPLSRLSALASSVYSLSSRRAMDRLLGELGPTVVHAHNLHPLLSPSVLAACRRRGAPTLLHCHSFLLTCPVTFHFRAGDICEECLGGREHRCAVHDCRGDLAESAAYALRNMLWRKLGLFRDDVTLFVTPSQFLRRHLAAAGFPEERIDVLPNAVPIPDLEVVDPAANGHVAFVGRLSAEKGVDTLLAAARLLPAVPFRIAGDGPLRPRLSAAAPPSVEMEGWIARDRLPSLYRAARLTVVPSLCYETFGMVAIESMSHGVPVVAARRGALAEIVDDGVNGLLFRPGDAADLALKIRTLWEAPELCRRLGRAAREKAAREYGMEACYPRLMGLYEKAMSRLPPPARRARW
jgi:glycosyltransferase involved in cell wall biosynthesis